MNVLLFRQEHCRVVIPCERHRDLRPVKPGIQKYPGCRFAIPDFVKDRNVGLKTLYLTYIAEMLLTVGLLSK